MVTIVFNQSVGGQNSLQSERWWSETSDIKVGV